MSISDIKTELKKSSLRRMTRYYLRKHRRVNRKRTRNNLALLTEQEYMDIMKRDSSVYRIINAISSVTVCVVYGILIARVAMTSTLEDTLFFSIILVTIAIIFISLFFYSRKVRKECDNWIANSGKSVKAFDCWLTDNGKSIYDEDILDFFIHKDCCD